MPEKPFLITLAIALILSFNVIASPTGLTVFITNNFNTHFETLTHLEPNKIVLKGNDDFAIREVWINVRGPTENSDLKVVKATSLPELVTLPQELVYDMYDIETSHILPSNTAASKIIFNIKKEWITQNNINPARIIMKAYNDGTWLTLDTIKYKEISKDVIQFQATTPIFYTHYIITGEKFKTIVETKTPIEPVQNKTTTKEPSDISTSGITTLSILIILIAVIAAIGIKDKSKQQKTIKKIKKKKK